MNMLWYFLTFVSGAIGALALIRTIERFAAGAGILPVQIGIALLFFFFAAQCFRKARFKAPAQSQPTN